MFSKVHHPYTIDRSDNNFPLVLRFGISQEEMNILGFTRVDEQIVFFEHRLSDGEELLKGLQTCVVKVDVIRVYIQSQEAYRSRRWEGEVRQRCRVSWR